MSCNAGECSVPTDARHHVEKLVIRAEELLSKPGCLPDPGLDSIVVTLRSMENADKVAMFTFEGGEFDLDLADRYDAVVQAYKEADR